ncbi:MAG: zinc ribbon domain-containing protein [Chloroflexota bacterium]|nr:zinc ribbon domain-containing protein [Chloroflexota bacterium]MDE2683430.1 zinc ribbon domain-containing protein [Chloroflexota bacterium]
MPIYEYRCQECRAVESVFVRSVSNHVAPSCAACGSGTMERRMSTFATGKTVSGVHEANPVGSRSRDYYSDPRNIGRHVEESFARHGVDMPDSVRQSIDSARSGEAPKGLDL